MQLARFYVKAVLGRHGLAAYAADTETVTSELVTNAVQHAGGQAISLQVVHLAGFNAVSVIVADSCPDPPVLRTPDDDGECWRGLHIVDGLSFHWGWRPQEPGKVVYAILTREER